MKIKSKYFIEYKLLFFYLLFDLNNTLKLYFISLKINIYVEG